MTGTDMVHPRAESADRSLGGLFVEKKRLLFLTNHLFVGGVDKAVVDIVNGLDKDRFDVTLMVLFRFDPDRHVIDPRVHVKPVFKTYFKGLSRLLSLCPQTWLYRRLIKERYDYEIAFQAGVPTRLLSRSPSQAVKIAWMHGLDMEHGEEHRRFDKMVFVSQEVLDTFAPVFGRREDMVLCYNPMNCAAIEQAAAEPIEEETPDVRPILCTVGRFSPEKGYLRLLACHKALLDEGIRQQLWFVGDGDERGSMEAYIRENHLEDSVKLWGYQTNPYRCVSRADVFVCSSFNEGFSVAATEAVLLGRPVVTTNVCGARELLGDSEYGIVTENSEEALLDGLRRMLPEEVRRRYAALAAERADAFCRTDRIGAIEALFTGDEKDR